MILKPLFLLPDMHAIHLFPPLYLVGQDKLFFEQWIKGHMHGPWHNPAGHKMLSAKVWTLCEAFFSDFSKPQNPLYCFEEKRRCLGFN